MEVSSAKRTMESGGSILTRSLMNAENRVGPRIEPSGTPEDGKPSEEKL